MPRDYYEILGVPKSADAPAIKKAFRKLAKKYHPDINKDPGADKQFAEAQEANDVLSNPEKRKLYDQFGHASVQSGPSTSGPTGGYRKTYSTPGGQSFSSEDLGGDFSIDDLFSQFFGKGGAGGAGAGPGSRRTHSRTSTRPQPVKGQDIKHAVTVPFGQAASGGSVSLRLQSPTGTQTIDVKIPKACPDNTKLRIRGKGQPSPNGGQPGDLLLTVNVKPHPYFKRDNLDLHLDVPVNLHEAIFGAEIQIPTLTGKANLKVPPHSTTGRKLRLRGAGLEDAKGNKGDLYAVIRPDIPAETPDALAKAIEPLKDSLPDPRSNLNW